MSKIINNALCIIQQVDDGGLDIIKNVLTYEIEISGISVSENDYQDMLTEILYQIGLNKKFSLLPY